MGNNNAENEKGADEDIARTVQDNIWVIDTCDLQIEAEDCLKVEATIGLDFVVGLVSHTLGSWCTAHVSYWRASNSDTLEIDARRWGSRVRMPCSWSGRGKSE
ncbi:predicted protein [Sclerotinia sclerotiorum 1980 UF-70]|uniref:Uncharacterized protein n=1 Tax=Sclerotinia sclerotiorum (strain ATCC 18683 / 1980 / Ss-1) TaxID=665079 RepID=A7EFS8_SCLS1|nr:predicted protein [Sclerotinia sclerotiorum 1980 UF-70]EDO01694.1 predicted protein [Sclerotinia sclerotiorum 1980 UF-70]